jgi:integration host factor subunit beta
MNRLELVEALREENGLTKSEATAIVDMFFDEMSNALAKDDRVEIRGLFSFYSKKYKEYIGRNPKTGETIVVKPKKLPYFKCGKKLYKRVNH